MNRGAPVAHPVGRKHVMAACGGAVAAETATAQRLVHVGAFLHEPLHGRDALFGREGHDALVPLFHQARVQRGALEHLAPQRASFAVRARELLVRPYGQHVQTGGVQPGKLIQLFGSELSVFHVPEYLSFSRLREPQKQATLCP